MKPGGERTGPNYASVCPQRGCLVGAASSLCALCRAGPPLDPQWPGSDPQARRQELRSPVTITVPVEPEALMSFTKRQSPAVAWPTAMVPVPLFPELRVVPAQQQALILGTRDR
jgi:hypothetical protein